MVSILSTLGLAYWQAMVWNRHPPRGCGESDDPRTRRWDFFFDDPGLVPAPRPSRGRELADPGAYDWTLFFDEPGATPAPRPPGGGELAGP